MSDKEVDKLKKDLQDCKNEKGEMDELLKLIVEQLTKTQEQFMILRLYPHHNRENWWISEYERFWILNQEGQTKKVLEERKNQLEKDIENYEHMLEEAADLEKSWNKDATDFKGTRCK